MSANLIGVTVRGEAMVSDKAYAILAKGAVCSHRTAIGIWPSALATPGQRVAIR
jgi:hypothetical protein